MQHTHIKANQAWWKIDWREILDYRDLLFMLVLRDLTSVYKQTILGPLWFVIQPLITSVVFTIIFGTVAKVPTDGIPQFIFYMSGTVFWNYFQGCMTHSASSLGSNTSLMTKVYFPRLIIPLSGAMSNLAYFGLNLIMFFGFYFYFLFFTTATMHPQVNLIFLPFLVLQCALLGIGIGLWVAAMTIKYRDLRFALPFLISIWMYATPIVYPASLVVNPAMRLVLCMNPMTFIVESVRFLLTGTGTVTLTCAMLSIGMTIFFLVTGLFLFNRAQRTFVDMI